MKEPQLFPFRNGELVQFVAKQFYKNEFCHWLTKEQARTTVELTFKDFGRGRSSVTIVFEDAAGRTFPFFLKTATDMLPHMVRGKVYGTFVPVKMGANFAWSLEAAQ